MKKLLPAALVGAVLGALVTGLILRPEKRETHEDAEAHDEKHHEEDRVSRGADGSVVLKISVEQQASAGLQMAPLGATNLAPRWRALGRVLDPAPLAQQLAEISTTRAALTASTREHERARKLFELGQNSSARALETAEATWRRDEVLVEAARSKLLATWGPAIAGRKDLDAFVRSLTSLQSSVVRLDVPLGQPLPASPAGIEVSLLGTETWSVADWLGAAPMADPLTQGEGALGLVKAGAFKPGAPVAAYIAGPGPSQSGVVVPRAALVRHAGLVYVYEQTGKEEFTRRPVTLEQPLATGWFTGNGLKPGGSVVISGAQSLLSEELKGQGGEE